MRIKNNGLLGWWFWWGYMDERIYDRVINSGNVNLCSFIRTILIWAPLKTLFVLGCISFLVFGLIIGPIFYAFYTMLMIFLGVLTFVLIAGIFSFLGSATAKSETGQVIGEWIRAKKSKICPIITID